MIEKLRASLAGLNERERKLMLALGVVAIVLVFGLPIWIISSSITEMEEESEEIYSVLREIRHSRMTLAQRASERAAAEARYRRAAPPLGTFLEREFRAQELPAPRNARDQPEQVIGEFRRRAIRAEVQNAGLRPVINLLAGIENAAEPVAVSRLKIEHVRQGDSYNLEVGVLAYERDGAGSSDSSGSSSMRSTRSGMRAGPATP